MSESLDGTEYPALTVRPVGPRAESSSSTSSATVSDNNTKHKRATKKRKQFQRKDVITTACTACQDRKSKCSGQGDKPCFSCQIKSTECLFQSKNDKRTLKGERAVSDNLRAEVSHLKADVLLKDVILDIIRKSSNEDLYQIVNLIREAPAKMGSTEPDYNDILGTYNSMLHTREAYRVEVVEAYQMLSMWCLICGPGALCVCGVAGAAGPEYHS